MKLRFTIRHLLWLSLSCVLAHLSGANVASAQSAAESKPKEQLTDFAEWVMFHSNPDPLPKKFAESFGMPTATDDLLFYMMNIKRDDGSHAGTFVKRRASGHIDILFIVSRSNNGKYYYQTSADGKLIKALHLNSGPEGLTTIANDDAQKAFEHEKSFWLEQQTKAANVPFIVPSE
ncbi:MAG TPA: hypothetical protein VGJ04_06200 [Pirellulales bacterium]